MTTTMTLKAAKANAGAISTRNSKMPGSSFAISPSKCGVGGKLAAVAGSTCSKCYAVKLEKLRPSVRQGWGNNYLAATRLIETNPAAWATAMAFQIRKAVVKTGEPFHRWFDAGDLQSVDMLRAIALTAEATPEVDHWLPTREAAIVKEYRARFGELPENLVVRISATMVDDKPIQGHATTSTVHRKDAAVNGHVCPASHQGNACGTCRACWSPAVANVSYPLH